MKILLVANFFPLRAETFILEQVNSLIEAGHDVRILVLYGGEPEGFDERSRRNDVQEKIIDGTVFGKRLGKRFSQTLTGLVCSLVKYPRALFFARHGRHAYRGQLAALLGSCKALGKFDVIYAFFGPAGSIAAMLRDVGFMEGPLATNFLGYDITRAIKIHGAETYRFLFARGELFLPNAEHMRELLVHLGAPESRTKLHRLGVDTERFSFVDRSERRLPPLIISIGRMVEKKGFVYLLDACALLREWGAEFQLEVLGDGPGRGELEGRCQELGLCDQVSFLGWCDQEKVAEQLCRADILVAASVVASDGDEEGLPLTLVEAAATGLPLVGTKHAGIPEIVRDGETGFLVEERDSEALARAIQQLLDDRDLRLKLGGSARRIVEQAFNSQAQAVALGAALRGISSHSSGE